LKGFPYDEHPTGWYQVGWSAELAPGALQPLTIFGQDVVLYRAESGEARLIDSACPHLGAYLGDGAVVGDCVQCPFHGWQFDLDGVNSHIPFSDHPKSNVSVRQWTIEEKDGFILAWYDAAGREPFWRWPGVPELNDDPAYYPPERQHLGVKTVLPQQMFENGPDALHFCFVHGSGEPVDIVYWKEDYPFLHYEAELKLGADKAPTWLTPNGPAVATIRTLATIGIGVVRFTLEDMEVTQLVCVTPVDHDTSMCLSTTTGKRNAASPDTPDQRTLGMMKFQHAQIARDFAIWEKQVYIDRPPFSGPEERYFARFRRWINEYYPSHATGRTGAGDEGDDD
jgi:3-ketosteroid 9alpha-monooxygenase subunit A